MKQWIKHFFEKQQIPWVLAFLIATSAGLYFRTYSLRHEQLPPPEKIAAQYVEKELTTQFKNLLDAQGSTLSSDDKLKFAREQAQKMIQSDPVSYQKVVSDTTEKIRSSMPMSSGHRYLLEADPYYYLYLTEQIIQHGRLAEKMKGGQYYHPLMHAPYGYWTAVTWHPYVGWLVGQVIHLFSPQMEWMEALGWVPIILTVLACLSFLYLAKALQISAFPFWIGAMALMLAPIFIQRSGFGWYDTDPYNYIFPFTILALVSTGLKNPQWTWRCALASGFLTGLYGLFWTGWPFMLLLVPGALLAAYLAVRFGVIFPARALELPRRYFMVHVCASILFALIFLTPQGFFESVKLGWMILRKFSLSDADVWPNIFLTVGEAKSASVKKLIYLSGNYITFTIAIFGLMRAGWLAWKNKLAPELMQWFFLVIFSIPLFILPLKTERFGVLFVIPISIWTLFGAREILKKLEVFLGFFVFFKNTKHSKFAGLVILAAIFLPLPLLFANIVSRGAPMIMDEAWYETMQDLRKKTPENSIVNSWWPPGYFVVGLAHRRVIADGGTQHLRESYWVARTLLSTDENEAAGLLRMLNQSGNDALLYLKAFGVDISDAVNLIMSVMPLSRADALRSLPTDMPVMVKNNFLDLTHGRSGTTMPASYLMVYSDLIEQNVAVSMIARWNFKKARENSKRGWNKNASSNYVQQFFSMSDEILKYTAAAALQKREGDMLFFHNGVRLDLNRLDVSVAQAGTNTDAKPYSLFYVRSGQLEEKTFSGNERLGASVLLIGDRDENYQVVLADPRLIRSLLFRLYYLKGEGLSLFKLFSTHNDSRTANTVSVFELQKNQLPQDEVAAQLSV